jgi:SAM-dependent methyltransferase
MHGPAPRDFYDRQYHFGEDVDRPNPDRLWRALRELAPLSGATFLDIGCGVGWATRLVAARGHVAQAVGLDFSRTALQLAAQATDAQATDAHATDAPATAATGTPATGTPATGTPATGAPATLAAPVSWVCGDGTRLPFADGSFDRAFSFGSMEHFPDVAAGFTELARVLRPGAVAVSVVPNFYVRTAQPIEHRDTARGWRRIIEGTGLRVVRVRADPGPALFKNRRPARIALRIALRMLGAIPALRYQFIFVMRKP